MPRMITLSVVLAAVLVSPEGVFGDYDSDGKIAEEVIETGRAKLVGKSYTVSIKYDADAYQYYQMVPAGRSRFELLEMLYALDSGMDKIVPGLSIRQVVVQYPAEAVCGINDPPKKNIEKSVFRASLKEGDYPYVVTLGICEVHGDYIHLPLTLFEEFDADYWTTFNQNKGKEKVKQHSLFGKPEHFMLALWMEYRYGVPPDHGCPNHPDFPSVIEERDGDKPRGILRFNACYGRNDATQKDDSFKGHDKAMYYTNYHCRPSGGISCDVDETCQLSFGVQNGAMVWKKPKCNILNLTMDGENDTNQLPEVANQPLDYTLTAVPWREDISHLGFCTSAVHKHARPTPLSVLCPRYGQRELLDKHEDIKKASIATEGKRTEDIKQVTYCVDFGSAVLGIQNFLFSPLRIGSKVGFVVGVRVLYHYKAHKTPPKFYHGSIIVNYAEENVNLRLFPANRYIPVNDKGEYPDSYKRDGVFTGLVSTGITPEEEYRFQVEFRHPAGVLSAITPVAWSRPGVMPVRIRMHNPDMFKCRHSQAQSTLNLGFTNSRGLCWDFSDYYWDTVKYQEVQGYCGIGWHSVSITSPVEFERANELYKFHVKALELKQGMTEWNDQSDDKRFSYEYCPYYFVLGRKGSSYYWDDGMQFLANDYESRWCGTAKKGDKFIVANGKTCWESMDTSVDLLNWYQGHENVRSISTFTDAINIKGGFKIICRSTPVIKKLVPSYESYTCATPTEHDETCPEGFPGNDVLGRCLIAIKRIESAQTYITINERVTTPPRMRPTLLSVTYDHTALGGMGETILTYRLAHLAKDLYMEYCCGSTVKNALQHTCDCRKVVQELSKATESFTGDARIQILGRSSCAEAMYCTLRSTNSMSGGELSEPSNVLGIRVDVFCNSLMSNLDPSVRLDPKLQSVLPPYGIKEGPTLSCKLPGYAFPPSNSTCPVTEVHTCTVDGTLLPKETGICVRKYVCSLSDNSACMKLSDVDCSADCQCKISVGRDSSDKVVCGSALPRVCKPLDGYTVHRKEKGFLIVRAVCFSDPPRLIDDDNATLVRPIEWKAGMAVTFTCRQGTTVNGLGHTNGTTICDNKTQSWSPASLGRCAEMKLEAFQCYHDGVPNHGNCTKHFPNTQCREDEAGWRCKCNTASSEKNNVCVKKYSPTLQAKEHGFFKVISPSDLSPLNPQPVGGKVVLECEKGYHVERNEQYERKIEFEVVQVSPESDPVWSPSLITINCVKAPGKDETCKDSSECKTWFEHAVCEDMKCQCAVFEYNNISMCRTKLIEPVCDFSLWLNAASHVTCLDGSIVPCANFQVRVECRTGFFLALALNGSFHAYVSECKSTKYTAAWLPGVLGCTPIGVGDPCRNNEDCAVVSGTCSRAEKKCECNPWLTTSGKLCITPSSSKKCADEPKMPNNIKNKEVVVPGKLMAYECQDKHHVQDEIGRKTFSSCMQNGVWTQPKGCVPNVLYSACSSNADCPSQTECKAHTCTCLADFIPTENRTSCTKPCRIPDQMDGVVLEDVMNDNATAKCKNEYYEFEGFATNRIQVTCAPQDGGIWRFFGGTLSQLHCAEVKKGSRCHGNSSRCPEGTVCDKLTHACECGRGTEEKNGRCVTLETAPTGCDGVTWGKLGGDEANGTEGFHPEGLETCGDGNMTDLKNYPNNVKSFDCGIGKFIPDTGDQILVFRCSKIDNDYSWWPSPVDFFPEGNSSVIQCKTLPSGLDQPCSGDTRDAVETSSLACRRKVPYSYCDFLKPSGQRTCICRPNAASKSGDICVPYACKPTLTEDIAERLDMCLNVLETGLLHMDGVENSVGEVINLKCKPGSYFQGTLLSEISGKCELQNTTANWSGLSHALTEDGASILPCVSGSDCMEDQDCPQHAKCDSRKAVCVCLENYYQYGSGTAMVCLKDGCPKIPECATGVEVLNPSKCNLTIDACTVGARLVCPCPEGKTTKEGILRPIECMLNIADDIHEDISSKSLIWSMERFDECPFDVRGVSSDTLTNLKACFRAFKQRQIRPHRLTGHAMSENEGWGPEVRYVLTVAHLFSFVAVIEAIAIMYFLKVNAYL